LRPVRSMRIDRGRRMELTTLGESTDQQPMGRHGQRGAFRASAALAMPLRNVERKKPGPSA